MKELNNIKHHCKNLNHPLLKELHYVKTTHYSGLFHILLWKKAISLLSMSYQTEDIKIRTLHKILGWSRIDRKDVPTHTAQPLFFPELIGKMCQLTRHSHYSLTKTGCSYCLKKISALCEILIIEHLWIIIWKDFHFPDQVVLRPNTWKSVLPHPRISKASPVNAILGWGWSGPSPET